MQCSQGNLLNYEQDGDFYPQPAWWGCHIAQLQMAPFILVSVNDISPGVVQCTTRVAILGSPVW